MPGCGGKLGAHSHTAQSAAPNEANPAQCLAMLSNDVVVVGALAHVDKKMLAYLCCDQHTQENKQMVSCVQQVN